MFSEIGPYRLSKNAIWKNFMTHYKMTLVHPGTLSQIIGLITPSISDSLQHWNSSEDFGAIFKIREGVTNFEPECGRI